MPLTTALYTGLSGLSANQMAIDVIGNNISNVNTTSFKASRAMFQPQFSQMYSFGSPPSNAFGGTNPMQKGLGVTVGGIQQTFTSGNIQPTGLAGDLAIQGNGLFVVEGSERLYSRNGAFQLNSQKYLTNQDGMYVMGYGVDKDFNIIQGQMTKLYIPQGQMTIAEATRNLGFTGTLRSSGDLATAGTVLQSQAFTIAGGGAVDGTTLLVDLLQGGSQAFAVGQKLNFQGSVGGRLKEETALTVTDTTTVQQLMNLMVNGFGINTSGGINPPGGADIVASGGGYAIQIAGNAGVENAISVSTTPGPLVFNATATAVGESKHTSMTAYDSLGSRVQVDLTMVLESKSDAGTVWRFYVNSPDDTDASSVIGSGTVSFDNEGLYTGSTNTTVAIDRRNTGAVSPLTIQLDFSDVQSVDAQSYIQNTFGDGSSPGTLQAYGVAADGQIIGTFTNGMTRTLGQVVIATFANYEGLVDSGGGLFRSGPNSGEAVLSAPLQGGAGAIAGGALETSNVDISNEFINLIVASTGFSAASRVITTSNQLLTELLSIMR